MTTTMKSKKAAKKANAVKKAKPANDAEIRVRIDAKTKTKIEKVFKRYGMTTSDGVRLLIKHAAEEKEIPRIPNAETRKALKDALEGKVERISLQNLRRQILGDGA